MAIERAEKDTLSIPGLKPGMENKVKIVPVSGENFKNQKGKRFGKRNYHVNSADVEGNFEKDFDLGEENSWFEDGWAYPNDHGNNTYDYYDD